MSLGRDTRLFSSSNATHRSGRNKRTTSVRSDCRSPDSSLLTNDLYAHFSDFSAAAQESLYIAAPFIRVEALDVVLRNVNLRNVLIITTWTTRDVLEGASDLNVYPYLRSRGWHLYLHPGLHAKILVSDLRAAIVTSANITKPGLGLCKQSNTECASEIKSLSVLDHLWLLDIMRRSLLVQDEYFLAFKRHIDGLLPNACENKIEEFNSVPFVERQQFLMYTLPMSDTPEKLLASIEVLKKGNYDAIGLSHMEVFCTLHDMVLFSLSISADRSENEDQLQKNFFTHPLITAFAESIRPHKFFGEAKAWIQKHCTDVPIPHRRDLTRPVRILFDWFVALGKGHYVITRPNHSERLSHIGPNNIFISIAPKRERYG